MEIKAVFKQIGSVVYHTKSPMFNELTTWISIFLFYYFKCPILINWFFNFKGFMRLFDLSYFSIFAEFYHLQQFQALLIMLHCAKIQQKFLHLLMTT